MPSSRSLDVVALEGIKGRCNARFQCRWELTILPCEYWTNAVAEYTDYSRLSKTGRNLITKSSETIRCNAAVRFSCIESSG